VKTGCCVEIDTLPGRGVNSGSRIVAALVAGLVLGAALPWLGLGAPDRVVALLDPVGTLWLNALRMTVLPLVVALLIAGIGGSAGGMAAGQLTSRAMLWFVALLFAAAGLSAVLATLFLTLWPVAPAAAAALRAGAQAAHHALPQLPSTQEWLVSLVPANPFEAAASGAMLPLVVFAVLFGFAAARIEPVGRTRLLEFFQAVADTLLVLVRGVLWVAPLGVFALALGVGFRGGLGAAGAIGQYLVLVCGLSITLTLLLYPLAVWGGRVKLRDFARVAAPAQVVALSTQSSLASLPAMLAGMAQLPGRERESSVVLPLAVSLFRMTSPLVNLGIVLFVAQVNGVSIGAGAMAAGLLLAVITSWSVVGLPSQITFFNTTVPMSMAMGVPLELLPLLLAVEVISDLFRTVGNVTADMAVTALVTRDRG
jgi:Na+/H+-dicarboxylate symporter